MVDFKARFNSYIKGPSAHSLGIANPKGNGVAFIKAAIMATFDGGTSKSGYKDGKIDSKEFYNISEKEYNAVVKQMQSYYKAHNNRDLEYHVPTYNELEQMLLDGKKDQGNNITDFRLAKQEITSDEIEEPIIPNKTIGQINQEASGECYQDSSDVALSFKERGRKLLNRSVSRNLVDGGFDVTLYGAKKNGVKYPVTYHFSRQELRDAQQQMVKFKDGTVGKKYTSGDANVVLLDLAVEKYRKENNHKLLHKNTKTVKGYDDYLSSGFVHQNLELITGKEGRVTYFSDKQDFENSVDGKSVKTHTYNVRKDKDKNLRSMLNTLSKDSKHFISGCTFGVTKEGNWKEFKQYGLYEAHAFAIESVDLKKGIVYVSNSHSTDPSKGKNSETLIKLPIQVFKRYVNSWSRITV